MREAAVSLIDLLFQSGEASGLRAIRSRLFPLRQEEAPSNINFEGAW